MKITRDELLIAAFKLFMSVNYEKVSLRNWEDAWDVESRNIQIL